MKLPRFLRKDNPAYRSIFATYGAMRGPAWRTVDYASFIKEGYVGCVPVHACISMTAKSASSVNWVLMQGDKELDTHELLMRLARPNQYESGQRFFENVVINYRTAGNAYIYRNSGIDTAPPSSLYWLRSDRVTVIKSGDWKNPIGGYEYSAGAKPDFIKEPLVLHLKEPNPGDDWYGLSPIESAAHEIDTWNESVNWNMKLLQNDMRIPGIVTGNSNMDLDKFKEMWRERYQGSENAGVPLFLDGQDIKWESITGTAKDSDWNEGQKRVLRSICSIFGVPSQLLGDTEASTYANYQEARKAFYLETVLPLLDFLRDELNAWLVPLYGSGLRLDYDRDKIEALQEDQGKKYGYLETSRFLTVNEKRAAVGYEDIPEGDVVMVGMGEMTLADAVAAPGDLSGGDEDEDAEVVDNQAEEDEEAVAKFRALPHRKSLGSFWRGETERKALWRNFERRVTQKEKAFLREMRSFLAKQGESVVAKAAAGETSAEAMLNRTEAEKSYVGAFKSRYTKLFATALAAGRRMTEGKLYEFDGDDKADATGITPALRAKLEKLIEEAAKVITDETITEIQDVLRAATGTNLTTQEVANALKDKLVDQMSPVRARRIARTETGMLENFGSVEGFKENEFVNRKGWLCSFVEDSRDSHKDADGQEVGIDEEFLVGGERMAYPLDRSGGASAGNVINCLCAIYPVVE